MAIRGKAPEILAYAAGFIDGEGSISISKAIPKPEWRSRGTSPKYELHVAAVQTVDLPLRWLAGHFGGSVYTKQASKTAFSNRPQWIWMIGNRGAADFLREILPYMLVKHRQAELAIAFMDGKQVTPKRYRLEVSAEELARREAMRNQMLDLNDGYIRRHPHRLTESASQPDTGVDEVIVSTHEKSREVEGTETVYPAP